MRTSRGSDWQDCKRYAVRTLPLPDRAKRERIFTARERPEQPRRNRFVFPRGAWEPEVFEFCRFDKE